MVTMPGDRLWMPTLLMPSSFSSACTPHTQITYEACQGCMLRIITIQGRLRALWRLLALAR